MNILKRLSVFVLFQIKVPIPETGSFRFDSSSEFPLFRDRTTTEPL